MLRKWGSRGWSHLDWPVKCGGSQGYGSKFVRKVKSYVGPGTLRLDITSSFTAKKARFGKVEPFRSRSSMHPPPKKQRFQEKLHISGRSRYRSSRSSTLDVVSIYRCELLVVQDFMYEEYRSTV